jgi:hypothetical protein
MFPLRRTASVAALFLVSFVWSADPVPHLLQHQGRIAVDGINFNGSGEFKFAFVDAGVNVAATATGTVTVTSGFITGATVTYSGMGYTTPPAITVNSPTGSGAVLQAVVTAGVVSSINVINAGSGYSMVGTTITIDAPPPTWIYQTYWRNAVDVAPADGEPDAAVTLNVTNGLYEVLLGDGGVANMASIPASVFENPDVRLRVWFNDGTHGFQMLSPDKRIAAVGYTLMAENVPDGAITQGKIAPGAVGTAQLATSAVQNTNIGSGAVTAAKIASGAVVGSHIAAGAVGSGQLANGAVISGKIAAAAVGSNEIGSGAVGSDELSSRAVTMEKIDRDAVISDHIMDGAVGSSELAANAVIAGKIAADAVGTAQIAAGAVTTAKLANSAVDSNKLGTGVVQWVHLMDGAVIAQKIGTGAVTTDKIGASAVTTDKIAPNTITAADIAAGAIGSTQIAAGAVTPTQLAKPPKSGSVASSSLSPQFNHAPFQVTFPTPFLTTPIVTLSPYMTTGSEAWMPSTALSSVSASAFSGVLTIPLSPSKPYASSDGGQYASMAMVSGNPAIAFYDFTNAQLMFVRAADANGTLWGMPTWVDTTGNVGTHASMAVANGNPAIAYYDATNGDLKYLRATNSTGTSWGGAPVTVDSSGNVGEYASLVIVSGNPAIAYYDRTNTNLKYARANDASGATWGAPITVDNSINDVGHSISMAIVGSNPAIAYGDYTGSSFPKYIRATTTTGTAWGPPATLTDSVSHELLAEMISLAVVNGNPAVAHWDNTTGGVRYMRASNTTGTSWPTTWTRLDTGLSNAGAGLSMTVVDSRPAVSFADGVRLYYLRADDASGTTWGTPMVVDKSGGGGYTSLIMVNGKPAIAYYNGELNYVRAPDFPASYSISWMAIEP